MGAMVYIPFFVGVSYRLFVISRSYLGVSEDRGPSYSTLSSRILIIRNPKIRYPNFRKVPFGSRKAESFQLRKPSRLAQWRFGTYLEVP